ncbi:MAG: M24 family metallopeptidase, partial [Planctomycetia bacterium]|nr:M24 family metallopeptidase [Planctomycetia bacterium]
PEALLQTFKKAAGAGVEFVEADDILADFRYEKSKGEFACMEQADKIACAAVRGMLAVVQPGLRESQVAAVGDFVAKSLGADGYGFETIVTSGPRCRTIIGPATNRIIQKGEIVQVGCSPGYEGYKGISRRVVVMGKPTERQATYLGLVEEAYKRAEAALEKVVAGDLESCHVDLAPRNFYDQHEIDGENMKRFHTFSSAHGTGLTECLEPMCVGPYTKEHYGYRVGIMLDVGNYGHPNDEIAGGTVENAFGKEGTTLYKWSDLPAMVGDLVGTGM